jgi:hypothetical protein
MSVENALVALGFIRDFGLLAMAAVMALGTAAVFYELIRDTVRRLKDS